MAMTIDEVMTRNPAVLDAATTVADAARVMRDRNIGAVVVCDDQGVCGIVTDRDIVVRAVVNDVAPTKVRLGAICSRELTTLSPGDSVDWAVTMMRYHAVRRLPVVEHGRLVGIVSMGDLAVARDPQSALADVSGSPPNL
jgi:CBS domain-containing protein